ncbi:putative sugar phosphate/phosphate translocator [Hamiltosporidium magnivora]|nr:putative sugar phosphate/phosphate translocator [Hamiltosporidium magnivora]
MATLVTLIITKKPPPLTLTLPNITTYLTTTIPCAFTASLDIGISSYSLRIVSLAFYTMVKSSAPVFVLLSGFVFGVEEPSIKTFLTIFTIGSGIFLTTLTNTSFDKYGFFLISFASFMAGFRWAFVQFLIEKKKLQKNNILNTIRDLCLPICLLLLSLSLIFEGYTNIFTSEFFNTPNAIKKNVMVILGSGVLSFCLLCSEFLLVSYTSVVFLSVSGIFKELVIVFYSVCRKEVTMSRINYGGLFVSMVGMLMYNYCRKRQP